MPVEPHAGLFEWLFNAVLSALLAIAGFIMKQLHSKTEANRELSDAHAVDIATLKATALSEQRIRDIVISQMTPIAAAHAEIFLELKKLNSQVADMRVEIAVQRRSQD